MPLDLTYLIDLDSWISDRIQFPRKINNAAYIYKFHEILNEIKNDYNGIISYARDENNVKRKALYYRENTPIFHFFRLVPHRYYSHLYQPTGLWKNTVADENIVEYINSQNHDKYVNNDIKIDYDFEYVLYCTCSFFLDPVMPFKVMEWAKENKRHVVFKFHPYQYTDPIFRKDLLSQSKKYSGYLANPKEFWEKAKHLGLLSEYVHLTFNCDTNHLIKNSTAVWSNHSGVGFKAMLERKPVGFQTMRDGVDYFEFAKKFSTPEEADTATIPSLEDLYKFLTWYYKIVILDMSHSNVKERLESRLDLFFNKNVTSKTFLTTETW